MGAARRIETWSSFFGTLTRLYVLSGGAVVGIFLGNILGFLSSATFVYQALGAMIFTGGIWFIALVVNSILFAQPERQSEFDLFSESSINASLTSAEPQVPLEELWNTLPKPRYLQ